MKKRVKLGLDFDGVVAYNPFRTVRAPVAFLKRHVFGIKKLNFFYPKYNWQQIFWKALHESSIFPAKGTDLLRQLVEKEIAEVHLVTARYSFLSGHLYKWLEKYRLRGLFDTVNLNKHDEQPHLFKEKIINKLNLEIFIEDNWDIVKYLNHEARRTKHGEGVRIYWIYNIVDRRTPYKYKFPYLKKALEDIFTNYTNEKHE